MDANPAASLTCCFSLDFEDCTYDFFAPPLSRFIWLKEHGSILELENGGVMPKSWKRFCSLVWNLLERCRNGSREETLTTTLNFLSVNKHWYVPMEADLWFDFDSKTQTFQEATGFLRPVKEYKASPLLVVA